MQAARFLPLLRLLSLLAVCIGGPSCGEGGSPPSPSIVQVAGVWQASVLTTAVTGGECAPEFQHLVGTPLSRFTLTLEQRGAELTGRSNVTSAPVTTCDFTGTAGRNSIALSATCNSMFLNYIVCAPNLEGREVRLQTATANITITGDSGTGAYVETHSVAVPPHGRVVGSLTFTGRATLTR